MEFPLLAAIFDQGVVPMPRYEHLPKQTCSNISKVCVLRNFIMSVVILESKK